MTTQRDLTRYARDYQRIESAIRYIEQCRGAQPDLHDIAARLRLSDSHFQRLFSRWAGISPKRFLQFLTLEHTKRLLSDECSTLYATHDAGLSSVSRLHELYVQCESMTPGEYKSRGRGLDITYGFHDSPFGRCLLAVTPRGLCSLLFVTDNRPLAALESLKSKWRHARLREDHDTTIRAFRRIFAPARDLTSPLYVLVKGTNFQIQVWQALLRIPPAHLISYQNLAHRVGRPRATRAVANAVASNPIHFLIPCHRVIRNMGEFGGYRGGSARKKAIHIWEAARLEQASNRDSRPGGTRARRSAGQREDFLGQTPPDVCE